jgi:serine/threonine-protein kinase HipA
MRDQIMQHHGIPEGDIVGLLYHLGADCPGAVSCMPENYPRKRPGNLVLDYDTLDGSPYVPEDLSSVVGPLPVGDLLAEIMTSLRDHRRVPAGTNNPSPLAGVQGKIALTRMSNGLLGLPKANSGAPTTHILKVPQANAMSSVMREHLATRLFDGAQKHAVAEPVFWVKERCKASLLSVLTGVWREMVCTGFIKKIFVRRLVLVTS